MHLLATLSYILWEAKCQCEVYEPKFASVQTTLDVGYMRGQIDNVGVTGRYGTGLGARYEFGAGAPRAP